MSGERLSMRKIREVLRLRLGQGLPQRAVAQSLGARRQSGWFEASIRMDDAGSAGGRA